MSLIKKYGLNPDNLRPEEIKKVLSVLEYVKDVAYSKMSTAERANFNAMVKKILKAN